MTRRLLIGWLAAGSVLLAGCAFLGLPEGPVGVSLARIDGRVLMVRDTVYVDAQPGMRLEVGDQVVTLDGAEAELRYVLLGDQGQEQAEVCRVPVSPDSEFTVTGRTDCGTGAESPDDSEATVPEPASVLRQGTDDAEAARPRPLHPFRFP